MTVSETQEKRSEAAKNVRKKIDALVEGLTLHQRVARTCCFYAGMLTETLLEYEEPDVVMEQAFHRVAELLDADPIEEDNPYRLLPYACLLDRDTEIGRHLARAMARQLPKAMDDVHEIAIALVISDVPEWEAQGFARAGLLRVLIEAVIASMTYEIATQDFCDLLIEKYLADGQPTSHAILALGSIAGHYFTRAETQEPLPDGAEREFSHVMAREAVRHGTPGQKNWNILAASNDLQDINIPEYIANLKPQADEFFELIGLDDTLGRAVCLAKALGRMVAVVAVEDIGQIHPSIAKSLAKTGMILGSRYREAKA